MDDCKSSNGSTVNGKRETSIILSDGDVIELGRTVFIYRDTLPGGDERGVDLASSDLITQPGFATLLPDLGHTFDDLMRVACSDLPIVVLGETGTGKELIARGIHALSPRAGGPLVVANCGGISSNLVESELLGYRRGAFTGATSARQGYVSAADGGTLFLDEIGDLPLESQAVLLRVLEQREVTPVGGTQPEKVDFRVVAATHCDLEDMVSKGTFRADLLARLSGFVAHLPSLQERREDAGMLIASLIAESFGDRASDIRLTNGAIRRLLGYHWPCNIRELKQYFARAAVLTRDHKITSIDLPDKLLRADPHEATMSEVDLRRRAELITLLREHRGNISAVSRAMGKVRGQIQRWIRRYHIDIERFRRKRDPRDEPVDPPN